MSIEVPDGIEPTYQLGAAIAITVETSSNDIDIQWLSALYDTLATRELQSTREDKHTYVSLRTSLYYDTDPDNFPILGVKKIHWESVRSELAWFLDGKTNIRDLNTRGVRIWDAWADANGEVTGVYGKQWRKWDDGSELGVDQIANLIAGINNNPDDRRHIITAWHVGDIAKGKVALPACHTMAQWHVLNGTLHCTLFQRSADLFLGVPFNITSYALLNNLVANATNLKPGSITHHIGNAHVYSDHLKPIAQMCTNIINRGVEPQPPVQLKLNTIWNPNELNALAGTVAGWQLENYNPLPAVKAPITV